MRIKRLSSALAISVACHLIVTIIVGLHWVTQTQQFKDLIGAEVLQPKEPAKPKVRKPVVKPVIKAIAPVSPSSYSLQVKALHSSQVALNPPNGAAYDDVFFKGAGTNPFIDTEDDNFFNVCYGCRYGFVCRHATLHL